ncbi:MAG: bifunctional (p)ppGpp synthetase/guanosine-3',5'-bis(diphosphate) 3'-pyrophosphohydrolase [Rhodospirillaceae bacterium]|jgi:GTP diphosphokinase / guanosine-3',5'-bis(diphosphate) 3'-diphosphatase|nr:bifunctional (p)ppGpp synthetase/guanosine-3',5'-bis(diphosphate) 3'-pyrophosphohydrolase [Rhodospirillaceae bacterium]MBT5245389.1 bifunctional (p)ppGpp synthetase/guanosine-3',5'-bis(diphosphate) 3'-pyrophosphohydrolase [Rhodospirillaceae bacterium]MBT5562545.1 bifunctional (p)ppGpp synthetase/guanosine-3',5'-bis(diphosphate) 3'-pyrophosphohydrolase [Rhodospirillaceae bacterium]MBT6242882.1 bifunctional (p)ppGpp synthetase/guanosine-3',5'-bis(diphosphate) 3'-pyrophosphohydrolase [Rhodospiri
MIRQFELVDLVKSYDPNADEKALDRAYVFSMKAHGNQKRASGDPYFLHPLEVAGILTEYKLDGSTIITALLHDTIEDTLATQEEIDKLFGKEVGRLVDGVTKLTRIEMQSDHAKQAENFRKLLLAMSDDIRVLLVKLADRLHNMRTLHYIKNEEKRLRIAMETMEIYAPLAERIGMQEMKNELEDLAFSQTNPEARRSIMARLEFLREEGSDLVSRIKTELTQTLAKAGIKVEIRGREKLPFSIWRKMQHKDVAFEQLSDIMAFRVLVGSVEDCYHALGIIHSAYRVVPGRFKDYISTAKPNGYRSLHTGVLGPEQHRIEIQIKSHEMHDIAENGVAAHWTYKQKTGKTEGRQYRWIRELLDILDHAASPDEFLEHTKLEMYQDQVFCFTPRGDLINMPQGATPVDFAYAVHSEVGDRCVGAKVNGRMIPLRKELRNGDQVEILTSKVQTPSPTWERFVVTGKARARIRRFVHSQEREQYQQLGRAILQRAFREEGYEYADKALSGVLKVFNQGSTDDLTSQVGAGHIHARDIVEAVFPGSKKKRDQNVVPLTKAKSKTGKKKSQNAIPIKGLIAGMAVHYAGCCHPLPGDRIVGIITTGKGVTIHTIDCDSLETYADTPERWLDVSWQQQTETPDIYVGRVHLTVINEPGVLGTLSMVIGKNGGNISNLKIINRSQEFYDLLIDIEVENLKHLTEIIAALRATPAIDMVERARG